MQWLWLLPSLGYGIFMFATTGQATGLVFAGFSVFAVVGGALMTGRREPVNLSEPVRFGGFGQSLRVAIGNRVLPRWEWLWQGAWVTSAYREIERQNRSRNAVRLLERRLQQSLASKRLGLWVWLGFAGTTEVELDLENEAAHGLIVGATGSGKSQLLTCWLVSLAQKHKPQQLRFWLIDYKGGATLGPLLGSPWCQRLATDLDHDEGSALALLQALNQELTQRQRLCSDAGVARIQALPPETRPPMIVLAIDEAQHLLVDPSVHPVLTDLAARGRSLGIHLVIAVQSLNGLPRGLLANLGIRVSVGKSDPVDLAQLGFQRGLISSGADQPNMSSASQALAGWGKAVLIAPERQLEFLFPSRGLVRFDRLETSETTDEKNVFETPKAPFGHQLPTEPTESVVIPRNTFDFSIGLEKQLQLTAENHIV